MLKTHEFDISSEDKWKSKILADLKGKPLSALNWDSEIGSIDPILFDYQTPHELPANFPYKRGYQSEKNNWKIAQSFTIDQAKTSNNEILNALKNGVNHIRLRLNKQIDFSALFDQVMLDIITVEIGCTAELFPLMQTDIANYLKSQNYASDCVVLVQDPLTDYFTQLTPLIPFKQAVYSVNAGIYADGGATIDKQIALALAHGHEYIVGLLESGTDPNDLPSFIRFEFALGTSYFLEIGKIRAFRVLWATILTTYGVPSALAQTTIHITTSGLYYANLDIHNNLLRSTTSAMSAAIAGCDSMELLPYDAFLANENRAGDGYRLATNIQLILQEEAYLNNVVDAAGGSYYIESITDQIIEKSWEFFKHIEQLGGITQAFHQGKVIEWLNNDLSIRKEKYEQGELTLIGVNKFPNSIEKNKEQKAVAWQHQQTISSFRLAQF